ncbi:hypothetical protein E4U58_003517 [Claviceps cyperi]|nr:hypothetical protein E4U58_003517 [Claviceps cyperi]
MVRRYLQESSYEHHPEAFSVRVAKIRLSLSLITNPDVLVVKEFNIPPQPEYYLLTFDVELRFLHKWGWLITDELAPVSIAQVSGVLLLMSCLDNMTFSQESSASSSLDSSEDESDPWVAE